MYTLCRTTHPATGVEHSVYCYFFHTAEKSLIIAGANILRVFRLVPEIQTKSSGAQRREDDEGILMLFISIIIINYLNYIYTKNIFIFKLFIV